MRQILSLLVGCLIIPTLLIAICAGINYFFAAIFNCYVEEIHNSPVWLFYIVTIILCIIAWFKGDSECWNNNNWHNN